MASTTAVAQLNRVSYGSLDFPTAFDDLRSELQTKFAADFNDFAVSSMAIMLADLTAYGLDALSFYLDRRATDSYLETAQTRKAVSRLARQLGYKMTGAISASTDVSVRITSPVNFQVVIPQGFQFRGPGTLIFEAGEATTFAARSAAAQLIPVYEGETLTETFVGDGTANQRYELRRVPNGKNVVQSSVKVTVNGTNYTEVDFLPVTGGQYFEVGYNDSPTSVRFGDGTVSQADIPALNATISVTYIAASGLSGQVAANTITKVVTNLIVNAQNIPLTITNPEAAVGGDDPESLAKTKANAGRVFRARNVAVTQGDYLALSNSYADPLYGRVAAAQAYSTVSAAGDLELQQLLQDIRDEVAPVKAAVDAQVAALLTQTTAGTTALTNLTTLLTLIANAATSITTDLNSARTSLQSALGSVSTATSRATAGQTEVSLIPAAEGVSLQTTAPYVQPAVGNTVTVSVNAIQDLRIGQPVYISTVGTLTGGEYTVVTVPTTTSVLLRLVTAGSVAPTDTVLSGSEVAATASDQLTQATSARLRQLFLDMSGDLGSITGYINAALTSQDSAQTDAASISTDMADAVTQKTAAQTALTTISGTIAPAITVAVLPLDTTGTVTNSVGASLDAIAAHVDSFLSSSCSANLVTVPILTRDADGFYAAPTLGLKQSLQAFLDARKAVNQVVQVTSGEAALVRAEIELRISVKPGYSESVVKLAVASAMDSNLKNRAFGDSLYRSEVVDTLLQVDGVAYVDVVIQGPAQYLDTYGNLIIPENCVITKQTVTISTQAIF